MQLPLSSSLIEDREDKISKSYQFFLQKEKSKEGLTLDELVASVGWSTTTAKTYVSKKWDTILEKTGDQFFVNGISKFTEAEYRKLMSQVNKNSQDPYKPELEEDIERLVIKAKDSALLALDIYNRPATLFKSEGFVVMMIIAWTALLHAIFSKRGIKCNYTEQDGADTIIDGDSKAWELSKCVKEYYKEINNPVRSNIEFMIGIRNKVEHRFAPKIDNHIGGECQALLLNFDELMVSEFGDYYALKELLVFPLQTSNLKSHGKTEIIKKFQGKHYDEIKEYIDAYRDKIADDTYNDPKFSFRVYLVPKVGNHRNSSDMSMEFVKYDPSNAGEMESQQKLVTLIKEKIVSRGNPDGLKASQVVDKVAKLSGRKFNLHLHALAWKFYKIRPLNGFVKDHVNDYCYSDNVHQDYVYTPVWVDFLVRKLSSDEEYKKLLLFKQL